MFAKSFDVTLQRVFPDWLNKGAHANVGKGEVIYDVNSAGVVVAQVFEQGRRGINKGDKAIMVRDATLKLKDASFRNELIEKIDKAIGLGEGIGNEMAKRGIEKLTKLKKAVEKYGESATKK